MKNVLLVLMVLFVSIANATTPIAVTQQQAVQMGYKWIPSNIESIEKYSGLQECVIFRGRMFPGGFLAVQGSHPKANPMSTCKQQVIID